MKQRLCRVVVAATAMFGVAMMAGVAQAQEDDEGIVFEDDVVEEAPVDDAAIEMEDDPAIEMDEPEDDLPEPDLAEDLADIDGPTPAGTEGPAPVQTEEQVSWQDIVTVVRKPFLKQQRTEVTPLLGITMNDNLIQHVQYGAQLSYYLTDVLAVSAEYFRYVPTLREPYDEVAFQARRLPAVNKYQQSAALNFSYVPVYGKFAVLDNYLLHWEAYFTGGVGFTQSEVIPRDPAFQPFNNFLITPNVGFSMRFFLTKFLTVNFGLRDYIFVDSFEPANRSDYATPEDAKENADSVLINNLMFQAGLSLWWPLSFEYTTFR
ncbi:outer membrane beta-barrel domain-containing protein [Haliangium ochraceum]|uniref:Outer membrane beta-barrel domain-containing protein n=1 Tax=Haliangium ochraceum (strain DSM 14365 / JCM 11303 / SMP-2) TaxID=502025 RepID=D0LY49_HALO1|nr:outer membrane beta-barrel domain-containing protein [Haliangium ochraceum]ACY16199.1 hypothetical protein Hoch_3699 [Haliangium ochraceum DSM 14365]